MCERDTCLRLICPLIYVRAGSRHKTVIIVVMTGGIKVTQTDKNNICIYIYMTSNKLSQY